MVAMKNILVVEDEDSLRESLEMFLREKGYQVYTAGSGQAAMRQWRKYTPQVIILDIRLPDASGLELLQQITARDPDVKVIMMTAYHDMETTIEAMRHGAYDYIRKPLNVEELDHAIDKAMYIAAATQATEPVVPAGQEPDPRHRIVGNSPEMGDIFKMIGLLARNKATVLIEGETGSGKELIARVIHESSSDKEEPFVTVDCTTLVDNLLESELFGHERGAFTGAVETKRGRLELAGDGTIFFDEVGDLSLSLQAKLLRFLEYRQFTRVGGMEPRYSKARIIAATNRPLEQMAQSGAFRQDLLFRLKVVSLRVPPLRMRLEDLPELVQFFLARINHELQTRVTRVEQAALAHLQSHHWPGNVRELRNVLTKAVLDSRGAVLMGDSVKAALSGPASQPAAGQGLRTLNEVEQEYILGALEHTDWNITATAQALGVSRPTLRKRMARYGLKKAGRGTDG